MSSFKTNRFLRDTLGWILYKKDNFEEAINHLQIAITDNDLKNNPSVHYHLGAVYAKLKNNEWAKYHLNKALNAKDFDVDEKADAQIILDSLK